MKNNTLYLEAILEDSCLKIGIHKDDSVWTYEKKTISIKAVNDHCYQMMDILNRFQRQNNSEMKKNGFKQIQNEGRILGDELFTAEIKSKICEESSVDNLIIRIDDNLVHIPWELICIKQTFLCQQFNIGREVRTRQYISYRQERILQTPLNMWIISDPYDQLKQTILEGKQICDIMDQLNHQKIIIDALHQSQVMPDEINEKIRNFDLVHFAGHVEYHSDKPDDSGWHLTNGVLKASDILKLTASESMPLFVFSNACQSARTNAWNTNMHYTKHLSNCYGLANAFMIAGVKHYIGTICDIVDVSGSQFAKYFYKALVKGKSVGESVRIARTYLIQNNPEDIGWASYLLYGDPTFCYVQTTDQQNFQETISNKNYPSTEKDPISRDLRSQWSGPASKNMTISNLSIIIIIIAVFLLFQFYSSRSIPDTIKISLQQEIEALQRSVIKIYEDIKEKSLLEEYNDLIGPDPCNDDWTSGQLTIYVELDQTKAENSMLIQVIQKKILDANLNINIVERERFNHILTEKIQKLKATDSKRRLLFSDLAIILAVRPYTEKKLFIYNQYINGVLLRLVDIKNGNIIQYIEETFPQDLSFNQLCQTRFSDLIVKLAEIKKNYHIKGRISKIDKNKITMNIGEFHGVKCGQRYITIANDNTNDNGYVFKVQSVRSESCVITPMDAIETVSIGWKLSIIDNSE